MSVFEKFSSQVRLLLMKRYQELMGRKMDLFYFTVPSLLFFALLILLYVVFGLFLPDGIEEFFVPIAFWAFMQKVVVTIMYEKNQKLQEAMRMMGLLDSAYWVSYFIRFVTISFTNLRLF